MDEDFTQQGRQSCVVKYVFQFSPPKACWGQCKALMMRLRAKENKMSLPSTVTPLDSQSQGVIVGGATSHGGLG